MRYEILCPKCGDSVKIRGTYEPDTNATVLDDYDNSWKLACSHIQAGDYEIGDECGYDEDWTVDYGDRVWPY